MADIIDSYRARRERHRERSGRAGRMKTYRVFSWEKGGYVETVQARTRSEARAELKQRLRLKTTAGLFVLDPPD